MESLIISRRSSAGSCENREKDVGARGRVGRARWYELEGGGWIPNRAGLTKENGVPIPAMMMSRSGPSAVLEKSAGDSWGLKDNVLCI